jgi:hypothetical protein
VFRPGTEVTDRLVTIPETLDLVAELFSRPAVTVREVVDSSPESLSMDSLD